MQEGASDFYSLVLSMQSLHVLTAQDNLLQFFFFC